MDRNRKNGDLAWADFAKVDMRIGTIVSVEHFAAAKKPAYKMVLDFGDLGLRKTSAQVTDLYDAESLLGRQVVAVVNFPPKQIANSMSECLVLGGIGGPEGVVLLQPERQMPNGTKIG